MGKNKNFYIEVNDDLGIVKALEVVREALREIDTKVENDSESNAIQWDISKNVPGYSVVMRDEGFGLPTKFIVGKAPRVRRQKGA